MNPPHEEKEALAEGGNAFVRAASELADAWEKMEDPMDRAYARSIAECTAMNYMDMVEEKLDEGGQEPATGEEPERGAETAPETAPELAAEGPLEDLLGGPGPDRHGSHPLGRISRNRTRTPRSSGPGTSSKKHRKS